MRWDRQHPAMVPARTGAAADGARFRPLFAMGAKAGADWIALAHPEAGVVPYWAIEAKAIEGDSLGVSKIADHQIEHLNQSVKAEQGALLFVKFVAEDGISEEFAVPWRFAPWRKSGNGYGMAKSELEDWRLLGVDSLRKAMKWKR